jgi:alanine racemase/UDP-N-acetylmuramoyl-tripeptide--D-alanyl-D-alanine ligase
MAHIASFGNRDNIADEKFELFKNIPKDGWVLLPDKDRAFYNMLPELQCKTLYFGIPSDELPFILKHKSKDRGTVLSVRFPESSTLEIFINTPSLEIVSDIETAICAAYLLGVKEDEIAQALSGYEPSHTRMEIWRSPIGTTLINDSCSSDPISVQAALRSMERISGKTGKKIFVFGGMRELGDLEYQEHFQIGEMAAKGFVDHMVLVGGQRLDATKEGFLSVIPKGRVTRFNDTDALARTLPASLGPQDTILFKGPRNTGIDHVAQEVTGVIAPDRLIVDIRAITENISCFRRKVGSNTKILGMVKALAYGSNLIRLSKELQNMGLDHLGVSTPDEGVNLRKAGITLPILVMICTPDEVTKIVQNNLTPVINSFELVDFLAKEAQNNKKKVTVHLKVDTGMGRLGILPERLTELAGKVAKWDCLKIVGLMTHFACAEDPAKDSFTNKQIELFKKAVSEIHDLGYKNIICHAAATAGTVRFPESHFDMVRIGLGLYGVYPSPAIAESIELDLAVSLVSRIAEIRLLNKGHIIGYGATFTVPCDNFKVGVVPIGYHDGLPLSLSNNGHVLVNGKLAPIVGRISMDSMTIDLSDIPDAQQGSDVLIYGNYAGHTRRPEDAAKESGTISYELLTRLGPRIQRIYIGQ